MDDFEPFQFNRLILKPGSSKKTLQKANEQLVEKLEEAKEIIDFLRVGKIELENELDSSRQSHKRSQNENDSLRRMQDDLRATNEIFKRELKVIRAVFRMGGLRYSCRALDNQGTGTISVAAFRSVVMKSNVNLSDEEMDLVVRMAMAHGNGQTIYYEAFFNALVDL